MNKDGYNARRLFCRLAYLTYHLQSCQMFQIEPQDKPTHWQIRHQVIITLFEHPQHNMHNTKWRDLFHLIDTAMLSFRDRSPSPCRKTEQKYKEYLWLPSHALHYRLRVRP
jgi:hypothetical protein